MPAMIDPSVKAATWKARTFSPIRVGDSLVVVHGGDRDTEPGRKQQPDEKRDGEREGGNHRPGQEHRHRIAGGAADHFEIEDCRAHDLSERKGSEREVDAARAQHRDCDDKRDETSGEATERNRKQRRDRHIVAEKR